MPPLSIMSAINICALEANRPACLLPYTLACPRQYSHVRLYNRGLFMFDAHSCHICPFWTSCNMDWVSDNIICCDNSRNWLYSATHQSTENTIMFYFFFWGQCITFFLFLSGEECVAIGISVSIQRLVSIHNTITSDFRILHWFDSEKDVTRPGPTEVNLPLHGATINSLGPQPD